jgi:hypothetical protein
MLFSPGSLVATPTALKYLIEHNLSPIGLINRHINGDWGDLSASDKKLNDQSVRRITNLFRLCSR